MKRINNIYDNMLNHDKAVKMFYKIKSTCKNKQAIFDFRLNLNHNILSILMALKEEKYY